MKKVKIFGILNVTPDSFSDGGRFFNVDAATEHALRMIRDGADVIDVGGMSTRPGFTDISEKEEADRVIPVVRSILSKDPSCVISVDTFRASVAREALDAGASIINDVTGLTGDTKMASVIASAGAGAVLMRNAFGAKEDPLKLLQKTLDLALSFGISSESLMLDPGVGFTGSREEDMDLIKLIPSIIDRFGLDVFLGVSRKRVAGMFYPGDTMPEERIGASLALGLYGVSLGAAALRVHDVKQTRAALNVYERTDA